jgi:hypothetical protein
MRLPLEKTLLVCVAVIWSSVTLAVVSVDSPQPFIYTPAENFSGAAIPDTVDVITDGTAGSTDDSVAGDLDVSAVLTSETIGANESVEVTIELTNGATFTARPVMGDLWDGNSSVSFSEFVASSGDSKVVFRGSSEDGLTVTNNLAIDVRGITVVNDQPVDVMITVRWFGNFGERTVRDVRVPYIRFTGSAARDIDTTESPIIYAAENDLTVSAQVSDSQDVVTDMTGWARDDLVNGVMDLTGELQSSVSEDVDLVFQYTLSNNAVFTASPVMGDLWDGNSSQPFVMTIGGINQSYSTFKVDSDDGFASTNKFTLDVRGITLVNDEDVTLSITISVDDGTSITTIRDLVIDYIRFEEAISVEFDANESADQIDTAQGSLFFNGGTGDADTDTGSIVISTNPWLTTQGSWNLSLNDILSTVSLSVEAIGGLTAFDQSTAGVTIGGYSTSISDSTATTSGLYPLTGTSSVVLSVPADNTMLIGNSSVVAMTAATAKSGFTTSSISKSGTLTSLGFSDADSDGVPNEDDNCSTRSNASQVDADDDGVGDDCDTDKDGDGVLNTDDNCPTVSNSDQEASNLDDRLGAACDSDSDLDGVVDVDDAFPADATEWSDIDQDGTGDNADPDASSNGVAYLMTTSTSHNITSLHLVNSSSVPQRFLGTLFSGDGDQLGASNQELHTAVVEPQSRVILTSSTLESIFGVSAWQGPAMLEVSGTGKFDLMSKLTSPSGLISNTNCVVENSVHNVEGFDSASETYVRLINTSDVAIGTIRAELRDSSGELLGASGSILSSGLQPKQAVFLTRENLSNRFNTTWDGAASLEITSEAPGLKLLNLNFVNNETFFNFSCFESSVSGGVYLITNSQSLNISETHIINTSGASQDFMGTLYGGDGIQLGAANVSLSDSSVSRNARLVLSASVLENRFGVNPWSGPAFLEVSATGTFELMTKLTSPSGLISNTNCVRSNYVQNLEGLESDDFTYIRLINAGNDTITGLRATLYDSDGDIIGAESTEVISTLAPKEAAWINRNHATDLFGGWNGEATLELEADHLPDLKMINLNLVNNETFFNFSCYESGQ